MATLFVGGVKIGLLADLEQLLPEIRARGQNVEIRDEFGKSLGKIYPQGELKPNEPLIPWEPGITQEELDRRTTVPGLTYEEVKQRLGWK